MNIGRNEANPDYSDDDPNRNTISNTVDNDNNKDEGEDSDAVDSPTIKAYVVLAKKACKYYFTGYRPIHILALYLQCTKLILKLSLMKLDNPSFPISSGNLSTNSSILMTSPIPVSQTSPCFTAK